MDNRLFPIVDNNDLVATQGFYERLGFAKTYQFPLEGDPAFVSLSRDGATIGLGAGGGEPISIWSYVDDVDRLVEDLRAVDIEIVSEPADQPWGERIAQVRDPAGILVHLANG